MEGGLETCTVAGGEVDEGAEGEGDDVGLVGDGVLDAGENPTEQAAGFAGGTLGGRIGAVARWHTLEDLDVQDAGLGDDADGEAGAGAQGCCSQRGGPGAVN